MLVCVAADMLGYMRDLLLAQERDSHANAMSAAGRVQGLPRYGVKIEAGQITDALYHAYQIADAA
ncbi:MAG: hypothetical protein ABNH38_10280 [Tateyamaria sp.]|uniref:hypothetical protein n=2 Tax=Tateyamaria sp. TaxID=1929288 RepID=UPI0032DDAF98